MRVVQKFGGSSVADAASIKRVAERIVNTKADGAEVVVVISAMGDTTDELMDLALQVSPKPRPRELDMLLTAGERMSAALLAMAINDLGFEARSFTGSQAGVITTGTHGDARIIDITPGRIRTALADGDIVIVAGFQGVVADVEGRHHARTGRLGHHRGGACRLTRRRLLRDLLRRGRGLHRRPADCARSQPDPRDLVRGDARNGRPQGAKILHLRCVEYARRENVAVHVRSSFSDRPGTWVKDIEHKEGGMERPLITGVAHDRSESRIAVVGVPDRVGAAAAVFTAIAEAGVNIDMIVQNQSIADDNTATLHAAQRRQGAGTGRPARRARDDRFQRHPIRRRHRQGVGDRRRHAFAPRGLGHVLRCPRSRPASTSR